MRCANNSDLLCGIGLTLHTPTSVLLFLFMIPRGSSVYRINSIIPKGAFIPRNGQNHEQAQYKRCWAVLELLGSDGLDNAPSVLVGYYLGYGTKLYQPGDSGGAPSGKIVLRICEHASLLNLMPYF